MAAYNPDGWLDILGLFILAAAGAIGTIVPAWLLKKRRGPSDEPVSPSEVRARLETIDDELETLLSEVTQLRRASTHFGAAMADGAVENLRRLAFDSEERVKDAIRAVHRDVRECAKQLDN